MSIGKGPCYFISAGEFSGDLLAAELVHALREEIPELTPYGIVGETMKKANVESVADASDLAVMGVFEVARKLVDIRMLELKVLAWVDRHKPSFAVLVDFPGFHMRLAEQFHLRGIPVYQYVAPKVWAWGAGRIQTLRDSYSAVLGVLPFEEEFFLKRGVNYTYVGSPHFDRVSKIESNPSDFGLPVEASVVAFLPGSRMAEVEGILPEMLKMRREIYNKDPQIFCVIPLAPNLSWTDVSQILGSPSVKEIGPGLWEAAGFIWSAGRSLELMKCSKAAVVASGTATLECALAGTPMVVVYVMNKLSFAIAKRMVKLKWVSLVNLLMNREVVREHIQYLNTRVIAHEVVELVHPTPRREQMIQDLDSLLSRLEPGASRTAAKFLALQYYSRRKS